MLWWSLDDDAVDLNDESRELVYEPAVDEEEEGAHVQSER